MSPPSNPNVNDSPTISNRNFLPCTQSDIANKVPAGNRAFELPDGKQITFSFNENDIRNAFPNMEDLLPICKNSSGVFFMPSDLQQSLRQRFNPYDNFDVSALPNQHKQSVTQKPPESISLRFIDLKKYHRQAKKPISWHSNEIAMIQEVINNQGLVKKIKNQFAPENSMHAQYAFSTDINQAQYEQIYNLLDQRLRAHSSALIKARVEILQAEISRLNCLSSGQQTCFKINSNSYNTTKAAAARSLKGASIYLGEIKDEAREIKTGAIKGHVQKILNFKHEETEGRYLFDLPMSSLYAAFLEMELTPKLDGFFMHSKPEDHAEHEVMKLFYIEKDQKKILTLIDFLKNLALSCEQSYNKGNATQDTCEYIAKLQDNFETVHQRVKMEEEQEFSWWKSFYEVSPILVGFGILHLISRNDQRPRPPKGPPSGRPSTSGEEIEVPLTISSGGKIIPVTVHIKPSKVRTKSTSNRLAWYEKAFYFTGGTILTVGGVCLFFSVLDGGPLGEIKAFASAGAMFSLAFSGSKSEED